MTTFLWAVTGLLALLWSGLAWATSAVVGWTVEALSTGRAAELGQAAVTFKLPAWMELFVDTRLMTLAQQATQWLMEMAGSGAPLASAAISWLVPLIWGVWGIGLLVMLAIAVVLHLLIKRLPKAGLAPA